ncbi:MAG: PP2C family protein-serine/threonine phosphatase [Lentimicrobium sp.]
MKVYAYSATGKRSNNEDFFGYDPAGIFIVCDGVGGASKGEVASRFVVDALISEAETILRGRLNEDLIQKNIAAIHQDLNKRLQSYPEETGMGTTLSMLMIKNQAAYIAQIGDSRVYYVNPSSREYWRTTDHSLVQELVNSGIITESKARTHPKKNVVTRAIQANDKGETVKADIIKLNKLNAGDLFFLCTDGVIESFDDAELMAVLCKPGLSAQGKLEIVRMTCENGSSDNNTAILAEVEPNDAFNNGADHQMAMRKVISHTSSAETPEVVHDVSGNPYEIITPGSRLSAISDNQSGINIPEGKKSRKKRFNSLKWLILIVIIISALVVLFMIISGRTAEKQAQSLSAHNTAHVRFHGIRGLDRPD